jgi:hypothetical protein
VHFGFEPTPQWLAAEPLASTFQAGQWETYLNSDTIGEAELLLRSNTYTGRPCGSPEFVEWAEASLGRKLAPQPGGPPTKANALEAQAGLFK